MFMTPDSLKPKLSAVRPLSAVIAAGFVSACGPSEPPSTSQVAAKVNGGEVTVHQVERVVLRQPVRRDELALARQRSLELLIDQELAVQRAKELKIEQELDVLLDMELAKRDVLSRAYYDRIARAAPVPTASEIKAYYDAQPDLFKRRQIFQLEELLIEIGAPDVGGVAKSLEAARSLAGMQDWLRSKGLRFTTQRATRAAEQLPLAELASVARLEMGASQIKETPTGLRVLTVVNAKAEPVNLEQATPAIERFLLNERRRSLLDKEREHLRAQAVIEYQPARVAAHGAPASSPLNSTENQSSDKEGTSVGNTEEGTKGLQQ